MIKALIFDFDGLIQDTETNVYQSWQELYRAHGQELPVERYRIIVGTVEPLFEPLAELEKLLGRPLGASDEEREQIIARRRQRERELSFTLPPLPGVVDTLKSARKLGLKIGLASSSSCEWVMSHLQHLGLTEYFDCIKAAEDACCSKPDPALYLEALQSLGVRPEEAIALEDSPYGVLAAKRAGLFCVAVPNMMTRGLSLEHADLRLQSLAEMPLEDLLNRIERQVADPIA